MPVSEAPTSTWVRRTNTRRSSGTSKPAAISVPATIAAASLYAVKVNNHIFFDHDFKASDKGNGHTYQLTVNGAYPFAIGEQDFVIDGYIDWRAPSKDAGTQTSVGSSIQIKWDAGKSLFGEERKLYVGTELNMWHNKYGIKPIDGSTSGFDQTAVQALVKYHF
jgi:nucleoside-specific outer membrane channel protein Tsx